MKQFSESIVIMDEKQNNQQFEDNIKSKITLDEPIVTELSKTSENVSITPFNQIFEQRIIDILTDFIKNFHPPNT